MRHILAVFFTILLLNIACSLYCEPRKKVIRKPLKILVLIITSDNDPVYKELQNIWRRYMHNDPEHIEAYFIRGDHTLPVQYKIENDVIWSKTIESLNPGLINKTILSLEALLPRIQTEFDYILRTNLSSFYVFPRLLKFLETCPDHKFYGGSVVFNTFCSGSGFLLSPDLAQMLVAHKAHFLNNRSGEDDVLIGKFFTNHGISRSPHPRMDFACLNDWYTHKHNIPNNIFHFRIKNPYALRLSDDIIIHSSLIEMFYPQS